MTSLVWFRLDLRLADNPALAAAAKLGEVVPVFIWAPAEEGNWPPGAASRWWLHHSLKALAKDLGGLVIRRGPSLDALRQLVKETGATAVFWNRRYEPALIARDTNVKQALLADGLKVESFNSALLFEPWELKTYRVFTPFYRACLKKGIGGPRAVVADVELRTRRSASLQLDELGLLPKIDWARGFDWQPGEAGARKLLKKFEPTGYAQKRDLPAVEGTSRLSPHLHFGEISPQQVWAAISRNSEACHPERGEGSPSSPKAEILRVAQNDKEREMFLRQIIWREFAHHLLYHFPHTPEKPLRPEFERFPWHRDAKALKAWQRGQTGFPLVDAGMRELWTTGWMHNRVRMVAASFLVKDLLIPWPQGAKWFWDTLVDADLANNTLGWQWVAGCGADAAPFFRIFNPATQQEKFDPTGEYVRQRVTEPVAPMVDHAASRVRALDAYASLKANGLKQPSR